jgi:hypothetical protein
VNPQPIRPPLSTKRGQRVCSQCGGDSVVAPKRICERCRAINKRLCGARYVEQRTNVVALAARVEQLERIVDTMQAQYCGCRVRVREAGK